MKRINMILSMISLTVTSFLIILIIFAWYASNRTTRVNKTVGITAGTGYTINLERGKFENNTWIWENTKTLELSNLQPGDSYYFRFVIDYEIDTIIQTSFSNITSKVQEDSLIVLGNYVQIVGTDQNWLMIKNNEVLITEVEGNTKKTHRLFSINGNVELDTTEYNVADTFKFYDYGLGQETFTQADKKVEASDRKEDNSGTIGSGIILTAMEDNQVTYDLTNYTSQSANGHTAYGYFALEFNDSLSTKNYEHLDGTVSSDSNLYQCQVLSIGTVALRTLRD